MRTEVVVPVVLVYLIGRISAVPHVLLMRRGSGVAYMKNVWSTIAGVVNGDIELTRQASIEITGETGLLVTEFSNPELISTFQDDDPDNKKVWVRHLMMSHVRFIARDAEDFGVRLDWEHSEAAWVPLQVILNKLDGTDPEDLTAKAILCDEPVTPDFWLNLERMRPEFERMLQR